MSICRPAALCALAGLAIASPALGQSIPWLAASSGNWNDPARWTGGNVPNAAGETGILGLTGAYTVTQNVPNLTLDAISITNPEATLNLGGQTLTLLGAGLSNSGSIVQNTSTATINGPFTNAIGGQIRLNNATTLALTGDMLNNGLLTINPTSSGSTTTLRVDAPVTIGGTGEIVLNSLSAAAQIAANPGGSLTIGPAQTVRGYGRITAPTTINGSLRATVPTETLALLTSPMTNNSQMAADGGTLSITSITIAQSGLGTIEAIGSDVQLNLATINGGSLSSSFGGVIRQAFNSSTFNSVESDADIEVMNATQLNLGSSFVNNGSITVNPGAGGSSTGLRAENAVTISGTGEIILNGSGSTAQLINQPAGSMDFGAGQTIRGRGLITTPLTSNGLIVADAPGGTLELRTNPKLNAGEMRAEGGTLALSSFTLNQTPSAEIYADGSNVLLSTATVVGGTIISENGGLVRQVSGTSVLDSVASAANVEVLNAAILALAGSSYINNGSIVVNPTSGGSTTTLRIDSDINIGGTGEIILNSNSTSAQIVSNGFPVTMGANQTIRGFGQITAAMTNHGDIVADVPTRALALSTNAKWNSGTIRASGGTLTISGINIQHTGSGQVRAEGTNVDLLNAAITDGSIVSTDGGLVRQISGSSSFFGVSSSADVHVLNATLLTLSGDTYTNNGTLLVNPASGGSVTSVQIILPLFIDGTGEIILNAPSTRARLIAGSDGIITMGENQTLRGIGQIAVPMIVEGTIAPGVGGVGSLSAITASTPLTYAPAARLDVELASASSFDKINAGSHTINGGTINVSLLDGYAPALFATHAIIDGGVGSVVTGKFDAINGPALPEPFVWKIGYTGQDVLIGVSCPADFNSDFIVDVLDFLDFLNDYAACDGQPAPCGDTADADLNGDGFVDILDFLDFLNAFGNGC